MKSMNAVAIYSQKMVVQGCTRSAHKTSNIPSSVSISNIRMNLNYIRLTFLHDTFFLLKVCLGPVIRQHAEHSAERK